MPAGLSGVVQVAAGFRYSCALKGDGTVTCWGAWAATCAAIGYRCNAHYRVAATGMRICVPGPWGCIPDYGSHTRIIPSARDFDLLPCVLAAGDCSYGQCVPAGLSSVLQVAAGTQNSCALKVDHTVQCWGACCCKLDGEPFRTAVLLRAAQHARMSSLHAIPAVV